MNLPDEINGFKLRRFSIEKFSVVEYSKKPSFFKFLSDVKIDENDLLYEVRSENIKDAEELMSQKLTLIELCRQEFEGKVLLESNPTLSFVNNKNRQVVLLKAFTAFHVWDMNDNSKCFSIVSVSFDEEIDIIIDWVKHAMKLDLSKNIRLAGDEFDTKDLVFTNILYVYTDVIKNDKELIRKKFKENGIILKIRDKEYRDKKKPDFFICHDSRDKNSVVRELYEGMVKKGLNVWYDEFSLQIGDSLTDAIQKGIINSRFAIVILSPNFISNEKWVKYELQSLLTRQISERNDKIILPIWHGIDENDLKDYNFYLLDKVAGNTKDGIENLVDRLKKLMN